MDLNAIVMLRRDLEKLPEYSASLPTGTTIGTKWRRLVGSMWWIGEYVASRTPGYVDIRWQRVYVTPVYTFAGPVSRTDISEHGVHDMVAYYRVEDFKKNLDAKRPYSW